MAFVAKEAWYECEGCCTYARGGGYLPFEVGAGWFLVVLSAEADLAVSLRVVLAFPGLALGLASPLAALCDLFLCCVPPFPPPPPLALFEGAFAVLEPFRADDEFLEPLGGFLTFAAPASAEDPAASAASLTCTAACLAGKMAVELVRHAASSARSDATARASAFSSA